MPIKEQASADARRQEKAQWPDFEGEMVEALWCGGSEGGLRGCLSVRPCLAVSQVCDLGKQLDLSEP